MKLETAELYLFDNVTEPQLIKAFEDDYGRGEYIILSQGSQTYIQAAGEYDGPYTLEYRDGSAEHHYKCVDKLPKSKVEDIFKKYLKSDASWKDEVKWEKVAIAKPWYKFW